MYNPSKKLLLGCLTLFAFAAIASAANVTLTASDASGSTSMNTVGKWGPDSTGLAALPPQSTNDYYTGPFFLRTPPNGGGITFAGHSLTLQDVSGNPGTGGQGAPFRSILYKGTGGDTIIINNLTNQAGSVLNNGGSGAVTAPIFTGNLWTIAGNSTIISDQGNTTIGYPIVGSANLTNSGSAQSGVHPVTYTGNLSGFTGRLILAQVNGGMVVNLNPGSSNLGNPATPTPDQITIANGCALVDNAGLTFNNANGGFTLSGGNGSINAAINTVLGEPITDLTNGVPSVASLTSGGAGTLVLSSANNTYSGGTIISAGILQLGVDNAIPGNTIGGNVTVNTATLDLNGHNNIINALNGNVSGVVDTFSGGTPTLTVGANGNSGTFNGTVQNSSGTLSLVKLGAGTQTLAGYSYSGQTLVAGGTLSLTTAGVLPGTPGNLVISNGATATVNASIGTSLPVNNLVVGTNSTLNVTLNSAAIGINVSGNLTFQDNATNTFNYGTLTGNPTALAINVSGEISAPGANIAINITGIGLKPGTFSLITYTGTALGSVANFSLNLPPGVAGTLQNNPGNHSIDIQITSIPNQLAWSGASSANWDLTSVNWTNLASGGFTVFQQYTNGSVVAGDSVLLDDTVLNSQTNINLTAQFFVFPLVVDSTLPYSISGAGGIKGPTSLVKSNSGSLTLTTSNSFTGGTFVYGGTLAINNDSALGATNASLLLNGGSLQITGNSTNNVRPISMPVATSIGVSAGATARLGGVISGAGALSKTDNGTLILAGRDTFTGNLFGKGGTIVIDSGGSVNNGGNYSSIGQSGTDVATLTLKGTGAFTNNADFNVGDIDSSVGTLNIQDTAVLNVNAFWIASANAAGSTASGTLNMSGGTLIQRSTAVGTFDLGGRNSGNPGNGVGVLNMTGGYISAAVGIRVGDFGTGTINQSGGLLEVTNNGTGINLRRQSTGVSGTYNLNGGTLRTEKVTSSQASGTREFYFNGGTLQAGNGNLGATPFMNSLSHAYVRNGGALLDSQGYNIIISQALEHSAVGGDNAVDGGLTKLGTGTATLNGVNTFTGSITNKAGTLFLNSTSAYTGSLFVNAGIVQLTTASTIQGDTTVTNGAVLSVNQIGSATMIVSNLTLNGRATGAGATIGFTPTSANNPNVALMNCGALTLNGTNSISLAAVNVGTMAVIKYFATAGSGNITNLSLPQGATGYISNNVANSTLYAVITSTGPGLVWTGTNAAALNIWNIGITTNWLVSSVPTSYHQIITPGDAVTFNDIGTGTVLLNTNVSPASVVISNNTKSYTFSGNGNISGATGLQKLGSNTAILSLTNNNYSGNTVVSNGTLQLGFASAISSSANLIIGSGATLQLAGVSPTVGELTGSGIIDNASGLNPILTVGSSSGGTWNGTIQDHGAGGVTLHKVGSGTWFVGGTNYLNDGQPFSDQTLITAGTVIITNGGLLSVGALQLQIANGDGQSASVVIAGGTLAVSNNVLSVGYGTNTANGTLTVNSGTVLHSGTTAGAGFAAVPNSIDVGAQGATGTLVVNGGQVLNTLPLFLGDGITANGTLQLNGGLVQASQVRPNGTPVTSVINFNGGALLAATNSGDFIQSTAMVQSGGAIIDDGGFAVTLVSQGLQEDPSSTGGGLIKKGSGTLYFDTSSGYTGATIVSNGVLAGIGSISTPIIVAPAGAIGAGDAAGLGTLNIGSQPLTIQGKAFLRITKDGGVPNSDLISGFSAVNYGGTLVISNATSDATPLVNGDTFTLFSGSSPSGNFTSIAGSPGTGLAYTFNPSSGVLSVITQTVNTTPTNITFSVSGNTLTLSWPADHQGWTLQTNAVGLNAPNAWFPYPGSSSIHSVNITMDPTKGNVFFRLVYP
jgi:fibronectin-binding autotransporter adhesin